MKPFTLVLDVTPRWVLALVASLLPIVATILLIHFYFQADLWNFTPYYWNDQTWYWHQTLSFSQVGFNSGYYTVNEATAPLQLIKFSSAGPLFPVIFGVVAHFTGWDWTTGMVYSMGLLVAATLIFIHLARLDKVQIIMTGLTLLCIGPVMLFLPTNSQETFHQAGTLILAGLFCRLWSGNISRSLWWAGLIFLLFIALIRFSWAIFLPLYLLIDGKPFTLRRFAVAMVMGGALAVGVYVLVSVMSSPGHNAIIGRVSQFETSPLLAIESLIQATQGNLARSFLGPTTLGRLAVEHVQGMQIGILVLGILVTVYPSRTVHKEMTTRPLEALFHLYNLGVIALLALIMYLAPGYYRVLGLHVFLSVLLLVAFRRFMLAGAILMVTVMMSGLFLSEYEAERIPSLQQDVARMEATQVDWAEILVYNPDADPWCNTILFPVRFVDSRMLYVPAGMGISFFYDTFPVPTVEKPIRSHYLLLDERNFDRLDAGYLRTEVLAETEFGTIYRNLDAGCSS
jgi:hypothetical protein